MIPFRLKKGGDQMMSGVVRRESDVHVGRKENMRKYENVSSTDTKRTAVALGKQKYDIMPTTNIKQDVVVVV
jgi:hypothetical protein